MRKSRFTEQQIIGFLKQAESGLPVKEASAAKAGSASPPSTSGAPSTVAWKLMAARRLKDLEVENARPQEARLQRTLTWRRLRGRFRVKR